MKIRTNLEPGVVYQATAQERLECIKEFKKAYKWRISDRWGTTAWGNNKAKLLKKYKDSKCSLF